MNYNRKILMGRMPRFYQPQNKTYPNMFYFAVHKLHVVNFLHLLWVVVLHCFIKYISMHAGLYAVASLSTNTIMWLWFLITNRTRFQCILLMKILAKSINRKDCSVQFWYRASSNTHFILSHATNQGLGYCYFRAHYYRVSVIFGISAITDSSALHLVISACSPLIPSA